MQQVNGVQPSYSGTNGMQQLPYPVANGMSPGLVYVQAKKHKPFKRFSRKKAIGLGIVQIIIGVLCFIANIVILACKDDQFTTMGMIGHGFWGGILFIATGIIGILAGALKEKCPIIGFMVMCIISAVCTITLLAIGIIGAVRADDLYQSDCKSLNFGYGYNYYDYYYPSYKPPCPYGKYYKAIAGMEGFMAALAIIEAIVAICGSALCCKSGVCCSTSTPTVIPASYIPNQGQIIYMNPSQIQAGQNSFYVPQPTMGYQPGFVSLPDYPSGYIQPSVSQPPPSTSQPTAPDIGPPGYIAQNNESDNKMPQSS